MGFTDKLVPSNAIFSLRLFPSHTARPSSRASNLSSTKTYILRGLGTSLWFRCTGVSWFITRLIILFSAGFITTVWTQKEDFEDDMECMFLLCYPIAKSWGIHRTCFIIRWWPCNCAWNVERGCKWIARNVSWAVLH